MAPFKLEDALSDAIIGHLKQKEIEEKYCNIADISLSFKNAQMLGLLEKRTELLKKGDFDGVKKIQSKIHHYKNT